MYRRILALSAVALMVPSCGKKPLALVGQFEGSAHVKFYDQAAMPTDKNVPGMRVRVSSKEIMTRDKVTHREDTRTAFSLDVEGGPFPKTCSLELYPVLDTGMGANVAVWKWGTEGPTDVHEEQFCAAAVENFAGDLRMQGGVDVVGQNELKARLHADWPQDRKVALFLDFQGARK